MSEFKPTWKNTIHNDHARFGHISELSDLAQKLGYYYIVWNGRVYAIYTDESGYAWERDTGLLWKDVK